ncbi:hypothetical protein V8E51_012276 [Hyaloscypha variabilis]
MPRAKKAAPRGNHGGGRARGGHITGTASPRRTHGGLTLQEEARNTERHQSFWATDQRLRDTKVNFVSAGTLDSTKPKDAETALAEMTLDSENSPDSMDEAQADVSFLQLSTGSQKLTKSAIEQADIPRSPGMETFSKFIVDTEGGEPVHTGLPPPRLRLGSPTPSDSSEEVILFRGRDQHGKGLSRSPQAARPANAIDARIRIVEDRIHEREELLQEVLRHKDFSTPPAASAEASPAELDGQRHKQHGRSNQRGSGSPKRQTEEDAILADYIANMDNEGGETFNQFNHRELGGSHYDAWQDTGDSSGDAHATTKQPDQARWDRSDICDFDDLSTSDGVMGDVLAVLSKRDRPTGTQYLVVWEEQTVDEARWVPVSTLTSLSALSHIEKFESEEKLVAEFEDNGDDDTSDSDEAELDDSTDEDRDEESDLIQERIERMSDEQIARLLAKQEELGMGSAELMLFDEEADVADEAGSAFPRTSVTPIMLPSKKRQPRSAVSQRARGDFPPASLLADAYDGFDVTDFDRPSLKKKPKGRKGKLEFDLSDSELEASMQMAWDNDRVKKKERKQERGELRAQGLLGSKNGKPDLKQKYKEGMGIHAVKEEIKKFLMGTDTTLSLPPMDTADRKVVHELANAFKIKSKSVGSGNNRAPILIRTTRTSVYVERNFNAIEERLSRRFLPRLDVGGRRSGAVAKRIRGGGGVNNTSVSYRDGDVVGGSAPELGVENRGRAMLEKMGWSSGTALGALNNKGILQPVSHVVKTTKAGLG